MRTTTIVIGLVFGVILGTVLLAPLYVAVPARYVENWYYVSPTWALAGLAAGLLVAAAAGFVVGLVDDESAIRNGTYAGFLSSLFAGGILVLPASLIEATGGLLSMASYDTTTVERLSRVTIAAAIAGAWTPAAVGLALAGGGAALGAMGGVLYDLWRGSSFGARSNRLVRRSFIPMVGLCGVVLAVVASSIWTAHLDLTVLPRLDYPPGFRDRSLLTLPLVTAGAAASWFVAWGMRDVVITWRDEKRFSAIVRMLVVLVLPITGAVLVGVIHTPSYATPAPYIAIASTGIAFLASLVGAARSEVVQEPRPRAFGEIFAEILFSAILLVAVPWFVSGSSIIGTLLVVFPYARALIGGASLVDAPPGLVVNQVFLWHLLILPFGMTAIVVGTLGVAPFWLFGRALRR